MNFIVVVYMSVSVIYQFYSSPCQSSPAILPKVLLSFSEMRFDQVDIINSIHFLLLNLLLLASLTFSTFSACSEVLVSFASLCSVVLFAFVSPIFASSLSLLVHFPLLSLSNDASTSSNFCMVASNCVLFLASRCHSAGLRLYNSDISGTNPSSGLGSAINDRILSNKLGNDTAGDQLPAGGDLSVSKHIRPPESILGWYNGVKNRHRGGSKGYRPVMLTVNRKIPPSKGDPSGPVICARIDVMSDGSGAYAATPGGGSFCSKDISRINRALEAMVLLVGWLEIEARSEEGSSK